MSDKVLMFDYIYRDASNFKQGGHVVLTGPEADKLATDLEGVALAALRKKAHKEGWQVFDPLDRRQHDQI